MTEEQLSKIELSEYTLIKLAQLPFNECSKTFEACVSNLLRHYEALLNESIDK